MTTEQYFKNLSVPTGKIDVVLDTDTFNEIDDQFAVAYMLASEEKLNVKAIYAAPFHNELSDSPEDGMLKSYQEIFEILKRAGKTELSDNVFYGSTTYLPDENTPVISDAANDLAKRAMEYSPENPLYVVAIGAITNVASALLIKPEIAENIVIVWLGGHAFHYPHTAEFNMFQDIPAARVVFNSKAPLVQLPCMGVVSGFTISYAELERFLKGKNALCDFLVDRVKCAIGDKVYNTVATRVIWDVTAVAWLLNDDNQFMESSLVHTPIPQFDHHYSHDDTRDFMRYVYHINRDNLATDLFKKLAGEVRL